MLCATLGDKRAANLGHENLLILCGLLLRLSPLRKAGMRRGAFYREVDEPSGLAGWHLLVMALVAICPLAAPPGGVGDA
jgi:hypothetical protein